MADVNVPVPAPFGDGDDADDIESRAQLILITGLTLAVLFVAVVLLLNTVIYTENLATRGIDAGGGEAGEFREDTVTDLGGLMDRENRNNGTNRSDFEASAANYAERVGDHRLQDGVVAAVDLDNETIAEGMYIAQDETETFDSDSIDGAEPPAGNWTLATDVTGTRGYTMTVNETKLEPVEDPEDGFRLGVIDEDNETWHLEVHRTEAMDNAEQDVRLRVVRNGSVVGNQTIDDASNHTVDVDLTAGTVDGESWDPLVWAEGVEADNRSNPYDIVHKNGEEAGGTYALTVNAQGWIEGLDPVYGESYNDTTSSPYALDAVYSGNATVHHRTPELEYRDTVRVAPGERDD